MLYSVYIVNIAPNVVYYDNNDLLMLVSSSFQCNFLFIFKPTPLIIQSTSVISYPTLLCPMSIDRPSSKKMEEFFLRSKCIYGDPFTTLNEFVTTIGKRGEILLTDVYRFPPCFTKRGVKGIIVVIRVISTKVFFKS